MDLTVSENSEKNRWRSLLWLLLLCFIPVCRSYDNPGKIIGCPVSCKCSYRVWSKPWEVGIQCQDRRSWNQLPALPDNTTYLLVQSANMSVVRSNTRRGTNERSLRKLVLLNSQITQIEPSAFKGMTELKSLSFTLNKLKNLPNGTFENQNKLINLELDRNKFTRIPSENICLLTKLKTLNISHNYLSSAKFDDCFANLNDLYSVDISRNQIEDIYPDNFYALRNSPVDTLNMEAIGIWNISADIFKYLPHLEILNIQSNKLFTLDPELFKFTPHIKSLFLGENRLSQISDEALSHLKQLRILDMSGNQITDIEFGSGFQSGTHLSNLYVSYNPVKNLTYNSFANVKHIKELHLTGCKLQNVDPMAFLPLEFLRTLDLVKTYLNANTLRHTMQSLSRAYRLDSLILDYTNLRDLNNETFKPLENTSLSNLLVRHSNITILRSDVFQHLPNLSRIYLKDNDMVTIEPNAFRHVKQLEKLDLRYNKLYSVPNANSVKLHNLKYLRLEHNAIGSLNKLTPESFKGYNQLEELYLDNNNIKSIGNGVFSSLERLKIVSLSSNDLFAMERDAFAGLGKLQKLVLARNRIQLYSVDIFVNIPHLQTLDLSSNNHLTAMIKSDIVHLFRPLRHMHALQLMGTGLQSLPNGIFHNLTNLTILGIASNGITKLDTELFRDQTNLKLLTAKRNNIPSLSKDLLSHLTSLDQLDVSSNSFHCDCELLYFTQWIRSGKVYMPSLHEVTCKSPSEKAGVKLEDLFLEKECMSYTFYYIYWMVLFSHVLVVSFATMIYRLRWYIRYWRHLVRARKAMEREMGEERYVFDAFVSYTHQDQRWVIKELLPKIEYEQNIRLCLHQRNWLAGRSIARNITDSIEKSRKTVLVLSNAYAQSYWCELELTMAQHKILTHDRDVVVPIILEPIRKRYVTEQMVCLFASQTYVKWPQRNERKQRRFWRKLVKTLRPPTDEPKYDENTRDFLTDEVNAIRPPVQGPVHTWQLSKQVSPSQL